MALVQSSRCKKYELLSAYGEEPTVHIESEGDRLIRELCVKQLDTDLTLEKQKQLEKKFERGSGFVPLSVHSAGNSTLQELQDNVAREEKLEKLQILGLTVKEANAVLNGEDLTFPDSKVELSIKIARAEQIKSVIENEKDYNLKQKSESRDILSRHEKELALAVKPESTETKLLQFALSCQKRENTERDLRPPEHPINHLHELEESLFCKNDPLRLVSTVRRKRRQLLEANEPPQGPKFMKRREDKAKPSLWDQEEHCPIKLVNNNVKVYSCKKKVMYTIKNGKIVEIDEDKQKRDEKLINSKTLDKSLFKKSFRGMPFVNTSSNLSDNDKATTESERLTEEEIRNIPRFKNYVKGSPSKVLYIKNLPNSFKEDDLVQLFKIFQQPDQTNIVYRLMTGKMRGQAFVTFPDEETAETALEKINGTIIKDKPIIIQFGK